MIHRVVTTIVVLCFAVTGCAAGGSESSSSGKIGKPDMKVPAQKILKEFESNEAAADGKYKNKTLQVSGVVSKVDTDFLDDEKYIVQVGAGTAFDVWTVNCNDQTSKAVAKIKKGQKITVVGSFEDGGDLGIELKPCRVV